MSSLTSSPASSRSNGMSDSNMSPISQSTSSVSSSSRLHQSSSPHGILPLRQLVPIKIDDKRSCFVIGISPSIAKEETLRSAQFFGQFGTIKSIRFILNSTPSQALLRFATEEAASRAIAWCNEQTSADCPISAKHGYQKYCISFIKNKQCLKPGCPHRHTWCGPDDVITVKNKTFKVCEAPNDIFLNTRKKKKIKQSVPHVIQPEMTPNQCKQLLIVQRQFSILQAQYTQQTESVKMLLMQMKAIQAENLALKQQLAATQAPQNAMNYQRVAYPQYVQHPQPQQVQHYVPQQAQYVQQVSHEMPINEDLVCDIVDSLFQTEQMNEFMVSESSDSF